MTAKRTVWIILLVLQPLFFILLPIRRQPVPKRGVPFDLYFEDCAGVLEPVDDVLSEMHWVLNLDKSTKFRLVVL